MTKFQTKGRAARARYRPERRTALALVSTLGALTLTHTASAQSRFEFRELDGTAQLVGSQTTATLVTDASFGELDPNSPEYRLGCVVPTESACQNTTYLGMPCGKQQLENQWTCYTYYGAGFDAQAGARKVSVIDPKITPAGIDVVVAQNASNDEASYEPELTSYVSAQAQKGMGLGPQNVGIDLYEAYKGTGTKVYSCSEYVAKKTWSVSSIELHAGSKRQDLRYVVDQAFKNSNQDWAMAKKHGALRYLYDMEGKTFATMFSALPQYKNAFMAGVPANPATKTGAAAPGPSLNTSYIKRYGLWGAFMLGAINNVSDKTAIDSWARQTTLAKELSYEGSKGITSSFAIKQPSEPESEAFQTLAAHDDEGLADLLGTVPNAPRRYLDEELNELYALQERLRGVYHAWAALNLQYAGSGWSPNELLPEVDNDEDDDGPSDSLTLGAGGVQQANAPLNLVYELPETHARRAVVEELQEVLATANEAGCIADGITPCDWSPRQFSERIFHRHGPLKDDLMNKCRGFAGSGTFDHLMNLNIEAVKVSQYWQDHGVNPAEFNCTITTGSTLSMSGFEALQAKNAECKEKLAKFNAKKTAITAKINAEKNVRNIPDMIDDNGELKAPGKTFHWNEEKGNKYFGLGLTLDAGYHAALPASPAQAICKTHLGAHGEIDAYVRAMSKEQSLFNARAELDTAKRVASFEVMLLGKSFYAPSKTWEAQDILSFHPTLPHPKHSKSVEAGATIVIVVVPVSFKAGIAGEVGLRLNVDASASANMGTDECPTATLALGVEPYAKVEGFLSVSIDAKILEIGLRGYLTILELSFPLEFSGSLVAPGANPAKLVLETSLKSKMNTLSGRLELYGKVGFCPLCWKGSKTLVAWDGLSWNRTLFAHDYQISLPDVALAFGYGLGNAEGGN